MTLLSFRRRRGADEGFALVAVLGSMAVLTAFLLAALAYATNAMPTSRRDQDAKAALAAAQAGIDDYVARLNMRGDYFLTTDSTNPALTGAVLPWPAGRRRSCTRCSTATRWPPPGCSASR